MYVFVVIKILALEELGIRYVILAYRRFLPADHPWRRKKCFDGQVEERGRPEEFTLEELMQQLERVKDVRQGKHPQSK